MLYKVYFKANFSGRAANDNDPSFGFQKSEEAKSKKEARKIAASIRREHWGNSGYCDVEIEKIRNADVIYCRRFGKMV